MTKTLLDIAGMVWICVCLSENEQGFGTNASFDLSYTVFEIQAPLKTRALSMELVPNDGLRKIVSELDTLVSATKMAVPS